MHAEFSLNATGPDAFILEDVYPHCGGTELFKRNWKKRATKFPPVLKYLDKQMANGCVKRSPVPVLTATSDGVL